MSEDPPILDHVAVAALGKSAWEKARAEIEQAAYDAIMLGTGFLQITSTDDGVVAERIDPWNVTVEVHK
jgi:hypothetical protein